MKLVSAVSVCLRTPRLSLGHPGSFKSVNYLKCMRIQIRPRFYVSSDGRRRGSNLGPQSPQADALSFSHSPAEITNHILVADPRAITRLC